MTDHGIYEGDVQRDNVRALRPRPTIHNPPSCPYCGTNDCISRLNHEHGEWYCACGSLFTGSDAEWRRLADHRRRASERRKASGEAI